jgi:molybdenum cofactor biosynthesis enzyme MoaA
MEDRLKSMSIEITKRCNFRCNFCFANSNKTPVKEDYISDDKINRLIHEIKENKLVKVTITGGEPLFEHELFLTMI